MLQRFNESRASILRAVADRSHLHKLRIELAAPFREAQGPEPAEGDFDQVGLSGRDGVDVLIETGTSSRPALSSSTPRSASRFDKLKALSLSKGSFLVALQMKDCIALVRLVTRPAKAEGDSGGWRASEPPCDAPCSDSGEPSTRTT